MPSEAAEDPQNCASRAQTHPRRTCTSWRRSQMQLRDAQFTWVSSPRRTRRWAVVDSKSRLLQKLWRPSPKGACDAKADVGAPEGATTSTVALCATFKRPEHPKLAPAAGYNKNRRRRGAVEHRNDLHCRSPWLRRRMQGRLESSAKQRIIRTVVIYERRAI